MVAGRTPDPHMGLQPVRKGAAQHHVTALVTEINGVLAETVFPSESEN